MAGHAEDAPGRGGALWSVELLGIAALRRVQAGDEARIVALRRKDAALLCAVAVFGPLSARQLHEWLWPGADALTAASNLRQRVFRLRRATAARLVEVGDTLQLAADLRLCPLARQALQGQAAGLAIEATQAEADWLQGYDYQDCPRFDQRLRRLRAHWQTLRLEAHVDAVARMATQGRLREALALAQLSVRVFPISEALHRWVMRLHWELGERALAVAAFDTCEQVLREEMGLAPSQATCSLLESIQAERPVAQPLSRVA